MTFDELLDRNPKLKLADIIQLFLKGYDDKIYITIAINGEEVDDLHEIRIISEELVPYYDYDVEYLEESTDKYSIMTIALKEG